MKKIKGYVETGKVGSRCTFGFEIDDAATEEEIEELAREHMFDQIEWSFTVEESS